MNLSLSNGWGIVRTISDMVLKAGDGDAKYVLVKDPNKVRKFLNSILVYMLTLQ